MAEVDNTLTLCNDEKILSFSKLLDEDIIGLDQFNFHLTDNRFEKLFLGLRDSHLGEWVINHVLLGDLHDCGTQLEVVLGDFDENLHRDLLSYRRTDQFNEIVLYGLLVLGALGRDEEHSNVNLCVIFQAEIVHRRVGEVNLLLKLTGLFLCLSDQGGHLTEHIGVNQNKCDKDQEHGSDLSRCTRSHFVTTEGEDTKIEDDEELIGLRDLLHVVKAIVLVSLYVDEVERRGPNRCIAHNHEPAASQAM